MDPGPETTYGTSWITSMLEPTHIPKKSRVSFQKDKSGTKKAVDFQLSDHKLGVLSPGRS
jgi:hypothetical protein